MSEEYLVIVVRLVAATLIGSLIGFERTFHGRPAGFRTHSLVCVASALLMLVTVQQSQWMTGVPLDSIRTDPTRMAQGIMTGIGFLGAGVIFREGLTVRGLTTAASIWITAAIGILVGIGSHFQTIETGLHEDFGFQRPSQRQGCRAGHRRCLARGRCRGRRGRFCDQGDRAARHD
jgi:putative Mg2+ transporter-C (MgtC) family protein